MKPMDKQENNKLEQKTHLLNILFNLKGLKTFHFLVCEQKDDVMDAEIKEYIERF